MQTYTLTDWFLENKKESKDRTKKRRVLGSNWV